MDEQLTESYRIVLAQRRNLDVDLLSGLLKAAPHLVVAAATTDIHFIRRYCSNSPPDLVILDISFPNGQALDIGKAILSSRDAKYILLLDDYYNLQKAQFAEAVPAFYFTRSAGSEELLDFIRRIVTKGHFAPRELDATTQAKKHFRLDRPITSFLTIREVEVMTLLAEGYTVRACAKRLELSKNTVDNHKTRIMKKLDVHNVAGIVRLAIRSGILCE